MIKPGYTTTEFWTTLVGQVLSLLTIAGVLLPADAATLQDAVAKAITAIFVLVANAWIVIRYIDSRTQLKQGAQQGGGAGVLALLPWLVLAALALPAEAPAAPPARSRAPACFGRGAPPPRDDTAVLMMLQQVIGLQQQSLANQQTILALLHQPHVPAPAPPQPQAAPPAAVPPVAIHYYYPPPSQELPIPGRPRQELPEAGRPRQELPISGAPRQQLPEAGPPRQDLPAPGAPRQQLPESGRPPAAPPLMPPATSSRPLPMQRYTVVRTLCRPQH